MPGDINTYSLGLEFKLDAGPAMNMLQDIASKIATINKSLSQKIKIDVGTGQYEEIATSTVKMKDASEDVRVTYQKLQEQMDLYKESIQKVDDGYISFNEHMEDHGKTLDLVSKSVNQLQKAGVALPEEFQQMGDELSRLNVEQAISTMEVEKNAKQWDQWKTQATNALNETKERAGIFWSIFDQISPVSKESIGQVAQIADAFGVLPEGADQLLVGIDSIGQGAQKSINDVANLGKKGSLSFAELGDVLPKSFSGISNIASADTMGKLSKGMSGAAGSAGALGGTLSKLGPYGAAAAAAIDLTKKAASTAFAAFEGLASAVGANEGATGAFIRAAKTGNILKASLILVTEAIKNFSGAQEEFRTATYRAIGSIDEAVARSQDLRAELGLTAAEANKTMKAMVDAGVTMVASGKQFDNLTKSVAKFSIATGISEDKSAKMAHMMQGLTKDSSATDRMFGMATVAMTRMGMSAAELDKILGDLLAKGPELRAMFAPEAVEQYASAVFGLTEEFKKLGGGAEQAADLMKMTEDPLSKLAMVTGVVGQNLKDPAMRAQMMADGVMQITAGWANMDPVQKKVMAGVTGLKASTIDMIHQMKEQGKSMAEITKRYQDLAKEAEKNQEINKRYEESLGTFKQQLVRIFEPLLAMATKIMKPIVSAFESVVKSVKPFVSIITTVLDMMEKFHVIEGVVFAATTILKPALVAVGAAIVAIGSLLAPVVAYMAAIGAAFWVIGKIAKVVFAPIIFGVKLLWATLKGLYSVVKDVATALWEGFGEPIYNEMIKPIVDGLGWIKKQMDALLALFGGDNKAPEWWGKILEGVKWVGKALGVITRLVIGMVNPIVAVFNIIQYFIPLFEKIWGAIISVKEALFGSSFLHIKEGIATIMGPVNWVIDAFSKVADIAKKAGEIISKPFKAIVDGAKGAAKSMLGLAEKVPVVGKAASWVKSKLFGSGLLGIDTGVKAALPFLTQLVMPWSGIGRAIMSQFPVVGGFFKRILDPMGEVDKMVGRDRRSHGGPVDISEVMTPLEKIQYAITGTPPPTRPVAQTLDQEMGRDTKSEKELKQLVDKLGSLATPLEAILSLIKDGEDVKNIIAILQTYLPKMAETPPKLGPIYAAWG